MDTAVELFEREEASQGKVILAEGAICNRLYIVRGGAVNGTSDGQPATLRESGGFTFFGDEAMMVRRINSSKAPGLIFYHRCSVMARHGLISWFKRPNASVGDDSGNT